MVIKKHHWYATGMAQLLMLKHPIFLVASSYTTNWLVKPLDVLFHHESLESLDFAIAEKDCARRTSSLSIESID